MSYLDKKVSLFARKEDTEGSCTTLEEVLADIRDERNRVVLNVRHHYSRHDEGGGSAYKAGKGRLAAFTPGALLATRDGKVPIRERIIAPTGLVYFDFDQVDDPAALRATLAHDEHVVFAFLSPSAHGVKAGVAVDGIRCDATYKRAWNTAKTYLRETYPGMAITEDRLVSSIVSLCYMSADPALYFNDAAAPLLMALAQPTATKRSLNVSPRYDDDYTRIASALDAIPNHDVEYDAWLHIGMALRSTGQPWAEDLWDTWSQRSGKYDARNQAATWRRLRPDRERTIATLFYEAKQHDWRDPRQTTRTQTATRIVPDMTSTTDASGVTHRTITVNGKTSTLHIYPPGTSQQTDESRDEESAFQENADERPHIRISTALTGMIDNAQHALQSMDNAPVVFQRGHELSIITRGVPSPKWLQRPTDTPIITPLGVDHLTELMNRAAAWLKYDKRADDWVPATPPTAIVKMLMARPNHPFPVLEGIVTTPTLRPDGSVLTTPGYDRDTGLWLDFNGTCYPDIPTKPTRDMAMRAAAHLKSAFDDFLFAACHHKSAVLAALLSLVGRFAIQGNVPLFAVRATVRGSGKGLLINAVSTIATGRLAPSWPQTTDEDEDRKRLLTIGRSGEALVHIDNVNHPFGSGPLDAALTSPTFKDRILGVNEDREVPMNVVFFTSGNNMTFKGDMARRVVPIDLDPQMERPEDRTDFKHPPLLPWILEHRPQFVVDALTILRAYFVAGCPSQGIGTYGSFEQWSALVREALVWIDEPDPNEGRKDIEAQSDPAYEQLAILLDTWHACYPDKKVTLKQVMQDIELYSVKEPSQPKNQWNNLLDAVGSYDTRFNGKHFDQKRVGWSLKSISGRVIAGKRLMQDGKYQGYILWGVRKIS